VNVVLPVGIGEAGGNAAQFLERYEAIRERLPGDRARRDAAAGWLRAHGLPRRTQEAWKYTNLRPLWDTRFASSSSAFDARAALAAVFERLALVLDGEGALPRFVFVDGRLDHALSRLPEALLATDNGAEADAVVHPMLALGDMLAEDGATLRVPAGMDAGTVLIVALGGGGDTAFHLRHRVELADDARLSLIEIAAGEGTYLHNTVARVTVGARAQARHVRLQDEARGALSFSTVEVEIGEHGAYDSFNLALGATLARHEVHARLAAPHAVVHVNGAQLLGDSQVADLTSVITHDAPNCNSRQTVKNVLSDKARGVFQGKIFVARPAQKTDGYQMNQALLLSEEAEIDAKPELEIYADDVKCSHGATVGALDEEQLFYMRSRGVLEVDARAILVRAFLDDAISLVEDELSREVLDRAVANWWAARG